MSVRLSDSENIDSDLSKVSNKVKITKLSLTNCEIGELKHYMLIDFRNLIHLNLSDCSIYNLQAHVFDNLTLLESIDLRNNRISSIDEHVFYHNCKLISISLQNNLFNDICDQSFFKLDNLETLDLSYNHISTLNPSFLKCANLAKLYLNCNEITHVFSTAFFQLPNLTYLALENNQITYLPAVTFCKSTKIQYLNLKKNVMDVINYNTFNKLIELNSLNLSGNRLSQSIGRYTFVNNKKLTILDLSDNDILTVKNTTFHNCQHLKNVRLKIIHFFDINSIKNLTNLIKFELFYEIKKGYCLKVNFWKFLENKIHLTELKIIFQKLEMITFWSYSNLINLKYLHIESKEPNKCQSDINFHTHFNRMPKLETLILKKLNALTIWKFGLKDNRFRYLDLTGIENRNFDHEFRYFPRLEYLNLSFSNIEVISENVFRYLINLKSLDLTYTKIKSITSTVFSHNINLRLLDCSHCQIETVEDYSFKNLNCLIVLNLTHNCIQHISERVFVGLSQATRILI